MKSSILLLSVALLFGATSCSESIMQEGGSASSGPIDLTFSALSSEMKYQVNTRTLVREGNQTMWVANDRISVFDGNNQNNPFITKDGGIMTDFRGTVSATTDWYCALYPYNSRAEFDPSSYTFTTQLYIRQYAEPGSYASGMNLAVSRSTKEDAQDLAFYNSASYLRVHISSDYKGDAISSMRLSGNNGELLAGDVTISVYDPNETSAVVIDNEQASQTIYLDQVQGGEICYPGKDYYFVLAPVNMVKGYTLTLVNEKGQIATIKNDESTSFTENNIVTIEVENAEFSGDECGTITEDGLFIVTNLDCLYEWAERVENGEIGLGCYLAADIDFGEDVRKWPQIGTDEKPFTGKVIGNGKKISNFHIEGDENFPYAGFIAVMGEGGAVENLTFDSPVISTKYVGNTTNPFDDGYAGVIVARMNCADIFNYTSAAIKNCHVTNPDVSGSENVGGIVGRSYGRGDIIEGCTVSGGKLSGHMFVGGIVGNIEGVVENCHVKSGTAISHFDVPSEARLGGIVGTNNSGRIVACTADVVVEGDFGEGLDTRYAGGIAGANNGTIIGCAANGSMNGDFSGALAGESYGDIFGCYANVKATALIYKVKKNMNNADDVVLPTFSGCYWIKGSTPVIAKGEENGLIRDCSVKESLTKDLIDSMNKVIDDVASDSDYTYGVTYQYEENSGDDNQRFPYKATIPQR